MKRNINDLREILFEAMEKLHSGEMDVERAKQIANIGQVIVNSAVAETRHIRESGGNGTGFIEESKPLRIRERTDSEHEKVLAKYA